MPNISKQEQDQVKANVRNVNTPGQLNYLITLAMIDAFVKHPRYEMIHAIYKDFVQDPKRNKFMNKLETEFADVFTISDIRTASALAYLEFHRRVVSRYEDIKVQINGELPEYENLYAMLDALKPTHIKEAVETKNEGV